MSNREAMTQDYQPDTSDGSGELEKNKIKEIHNKIPDEIIPKLGLEFETEDAAYDFYNSYAYRVGFSVRKSKAHNNTKGHIIDRVFCCSCEGYHEKDKRSTSVNNPRAQSRFGCLAGMKVDCPSTGKFRIVQFIAEHKHETSSPSKTHIHRSHRKITPSLAYEIDLAESYGIALKASCELMARKVGGREKLRFIRDDYKNYLRSKRTIQMRLGDTCGLLEKNKEGRSFAMSIGVDHHKLSTIFGAELLYDETAEIFVWLFETLAKSMLGKKPQTILTDQDAAVAKALSLTWPETCHRLCI
ncbi:PREDICTED: protein FAR1-RELATED SEQUENCE 5-like [Lupinus angustifolius]|uniref:protein FAR1-RELATED SEQUENCE 5-like n=1 Tax=Lupinus angustifolius TaxID=3871 RepID=UPI00092E7F3A|nr:PREDICTED: protein FAR1-RELATED SEQUENCE 5-like [Lupinus angustifolius]